MAALAALGVLASAGQTLAGDPDDTAWSLVSLGGGQTLWIASEDLHNGGGDEARGRVLWTTPHGARLPAGVRYTVSDYAFACDGGVQEQVHAYNGAGEPFPDRPPLAEREVRRGAVEGAVFAMVCEGAEYEDLMELGSAREVMDWEAAGHRPPARPANRWNQGPGQPEQEPAEEREPGAPSGDNRNQR